MTTYNIIKIVTSNIKPHRTYISTSRKRGIVKNDSDKIRPKSCRKTPNPTFPCLKSGPSILQTINGPSHPALLAETYLGWCAYAPLHRFLWQMSHNCHLWHLGVSTSTQAFSSPLLQDSKHDALGWKSEALWRKSINNHNPLIPLVSKSTKMWKALVSLAACLRRTSDPHFWEGPLTPT